MGRQRTHILSRNELIAMYQGYPGAMEEEVVLALTVLNNDEERIVHNMAVRRITRLFTSEAAQRSLWRNVARAIIGAIQQQEDTGVTDDGKEQDDR
jgi:hypothetical protein